jgi:hypothetical protein
MISQDEFDKNLVADVYCPVIINKSLIIQGTYTSKVFQLIKIQIKLKNLTSEALSLLDNIHLVFVLY